MTVSAAGRSAVVLGRGDRVRAPRASPRCCAIVPRPGSRWCQTSRRVPGQGAVAVALAADLDALAADFGAALKLNARRRSRSGAVVRGALVTGTTGSRYYGAAARTFGPGVGRGRDRREPQVRRRRARWRAPPAAPELGEALAAAMASRADRAARRRWCCAPRAGPRVRRGAPAAAGGRLISRTW